MATAEFIGAVPRGGEWFVSLEARVMELETLVSAFQEAPPGGEPPAWVWHVAYHVERLRAAFDGGAA